MLLYVFRQAFDMDSDGGKPQSFVDDNTDLLRAVSFPNFLRGFWEHHHHHTDDPLGHSALGSSTASINHIPPSEVVKEDEILTFPAPTHSTNSTAMNSTGVATDTRHPGATPKLSRCDTWAGFGAAAQIPSTDSASATVVPSEGRSKTIESLSLMFATPSSSQSSTPPSVSNSTASGHVLGLPHFGSVAPVHHGSLLEAILHHDLAPHDRSVVDGKGAADQLGGGGGGTLSQHDKSGLFGLPSRVKVTGRELNMMSPISF